MECIYFETKKEGVVLVESIFWCIIVICICILCIFLNARNGTSLSSIVQMQNIVWFIAYIIYLSGIMKYYPFNDKVYIFSIMYLLVFNITCFGSGKKSEYSYKKFGCAVESICDKKKTHIVTLLSLFAWIMAIPLLQKSVPFLMGYGLLSGMNQLRYQIYGGYNFYSGFEMCLIDFVIRPIFITAIILFAEQIAIRKISVKLLIVSIGNALMLVLITAGRTMMVSWIMYIFLAVITVNGANIFKLIKKYKRYVIFITIVLVIFVLISSSRVNRKEGILYEIILYYFSGLPFFSSLINSGTARPCISHGLSTFSPIVDTFILGLRFFGVQISGGSQLISGITNEGLAVGKGIATNATASTLLAFYLDFGWLGPIIGGLLIGLLIKYVDKKMWKKCGCTSFGQYLFCLSAIVSSIQNYSFLGVGNMVTWLLIIMLFRDRKYNKKYMKR